MEQRTPDENDVPWAMQLAVRVEKGTERIVPPSHSAVCEAAAMAVVRLLTDPNPEWQQAVHRWESGRIRKVTRRARGVRWEAVQSLPGVTVEHAGAQVRSFVPGPVTEVPPELAKLQVAGLDLDDDSEDNTEDDADDDSDDGGAVKPPEHPYASMALNPDVRMSTGKAAAQCGHAAHLLLRQAAEPGVSVWIASGLRVHLVRDETWRRCVDRATVAVRDAGFTEVPPGTMTAIAWLVLS
jgi:peptidyl-tRNA hydrolase